MLNYDPFIRPPKKVELCDRPKFRIDPVIKIKDKQGNITKHNQSPERMEFLENWVADLSEIIEEGRNVPITAYRKGVGGKDPVLSELGINHIHPEEGSTEVLFFIQTQDTVIFLGLGDHSVFDDPRTAVTNAKKRFGNKVDELKRLSGNNP